MYSFTYTDWLESEKHVPLQGTHTVGSVYLLPAKFKHRPPTVKCWAMRGQIGEGTINSVETPQTQEDAFYI